MASGRYNSVSKTIGTIDITPLMDLTFMLLIIFIITVPALEFTTEVDIPKRNTASTVEDPGVELVMDADGFVKLDGRLISMSELEAELKVEHLKKPDMPLYITVDGKRPYNDVMALYRAADHVGFKAYLKTAQETDAEN